MYLLLSRNNYESSSYQRLCKRGRARASVLPLSLQTPAKSLSRPQVTQSALNPPYEQSNTVNTPVEKFVWTNVLVYVRVCMRAPGCGGARPLRHSARAVLEWRAASRPRLPTWGQVASAAAPAGRPYQPAGRLHTSTLPILYPPILIARFITVDFCNDWIMH